MIRSLTSGNREEKEERTNHELQGRIMTSHRFIRRMMTC